MLNKVLNVYSNYIMISLWQQIAIQCNKNARVVCGVMHERAMQTKHKMRPERLCHLVEHVAKKLYHLLFVTRAWYQWIQLLDVILYCKR